MPLSSALISGASRGLGAALARALAEDGWPVFAGVRDKGGAVPDGCTALELDVTDELSVRAAVQRVVAGGAIDLLINNAGVHVGGTLQEVSELRLRHALEVNFFGVWRLTREALPHMRPHSTIVMISSLSGIAGLPGDGVYAASKFALEGMSQSLAAELAPRGIRVVIIEPGPIATGFAGQQSGASVDETASRIVEICRNNSSDLRYPLGPTAERVAARLNLDRGDGWQAIVRAHAQSLSTSQKER